MKPPLSPAHGTGLGTTGGITAVIAVVAAVSVLAQCRVGQGLAVVVGAGAVAALLLGAGCLYTGRNFIGQALDLAPGDPAAAAIAAARGLFFFHLGMAGVFAGAGFAAWFALYPLAEPVALVAPLAGLVMVVAALVNAVDWFAEIRHRRAGSCGD